jgi:hypothetical protein
LNTPSRETVASNRAEPSQTQKRAEQSRASYCMKNGNEKKYSP